MVSSQSSQRFVRPKRISAGGRFLEGIVGILIAAITFYDVRITIIALYFTIAAWALLTGILELVAAVQLRKHIANEIWLIIGGIASIAFGVLCCGFLSQAC